MKLKRGRYIWGIGSCSWGTCQRKGITTGRSKKKRVKPKTWKKTIEQTRKGGVKGKRKKSAAVHARKTHAKKTGNNTWQMDGRK